MTEEEKIAAAKAEAEAQAEAEAEKAKDNQGETEEQKAQREAKELEKSDYEARLKRERDLREVAEQAAAEKDFKLRELKRKKDGTGDEDEEKPLTAKQLQEILLQERQNTKKELQSQLISEKAKKLAGSETEANLIIEIHKNRHFPEYLTLDEQLEEAYAIANSKKIVAQNEELKRSLRGKDNISNNSAGTQRDSNPIEEPKMSAHDISAIKAVGFTWDGKSRLYTKPLGKNKTLTYDPKTKQQKVIER